MKAQKAFTLVELVIVVAVSAILLGLSAPSFRAMILNNRITSHANVFVASMNLARSKAIKRGANVLISATDSSDVGDEWGRGWTVWVDLNDSGALGPNQIPPEELHIIPAFDDTNTLDDPDGTVEFTYEANGTLDEGMQTLMLCDSAGEEGRWIRIAASGGISSGRIPSKHDPYFSGIPEEPNFKCP